MCLCTACRCVYAFALAVFVVLNEVVERSGYMRECMREQTVYIYSVYKLHTQSRGPKICVRRGGAF